MNNKSGRMQWGVLFAVFITGIGMAWSQNKMIPIIDDVMDTMSIDGFSAGWLSSAFCVTSVVMAIPTTFLMNSLGVKRSGLISISCTLAGSVMGLFNGGFLSLMVSRIIEGIGVGMISVIGPTVISMWFPSEKRGLPMGIWGSWQMVSQGANFFFADVLTKTFGWKGMWYFGIILSIISLIIYFLAVKAPNKGQNFAPVEEEMNLARGLRSANTWMLSLAGLCFAFSYFGWCTWIAQYWTQIIGLEQAKANTYLGYMCILEIPVVFVVGAILDKVSNRKSIALIASILYIPVLWGSFYMKNPGLVIPFIIIYPIIEGGIPTFLWAVVPETEENPRDSGVALAILTICMNIGTVLGPPIIGSFASTGKWHAAVLPLCVSIGLSILLLLKVRVSVTDKKA